MLILYIKNLYSRYIEYFWDEYYQHSLFIPILITIGIIFYFNLINEPSTKIIVINFSITLILYILSKKFLIPRYRQGFPILIFYLIIIYSFFSFGILIAKIDTEIHKQKLIDRKYNLCKATGQVKNITIYRDTSRIKFCFIVNDFSFSDLEIDLQIKNKNLIKICTYNKNSNGIEIGDRIIFYNLTLNPLPLPSFPDDYQFARNSYFENIIGTGYAIGVKKDPSINHPIILDRINNIRYKFSQQIVEELGEKVGGIVSAVTVGIRTFIDEDIQLDMKKSSIFHLIAISGLHISLCSIFFIFILGRISTFFLDKYIDYFLIKKVVLLISLIAVLIYLVFSGITISAQRAFIMFAIVNFTIFRGNQVISRKIINYAVIIILIYEPHSILNPGLQMSILAVASLVCFNSKKYIEHLKEFFEEKQKRFLLIHSKNSFYKNILRIVPHGTILISTILLEVNIPHLAITPTIIYYFGNFSTYTIIANVIAIPLMSFIIMPLIIFYLFIKLFHVEHFGLWIQITLKFFVKILIWISEFFGNLPYGYFKIHQVSFISFTCMIIGLLWFLIWKKNWRFYGLILYGIGCFLCIKNIWPDIFIYEYKNKINLIIKEDNLFYSNNIKQNNYLSRKFLDKNRQDNFLDFSKLQMFHVEQFNNLKNNSKNKQENLKNLFQINIFNCSVERNPSGALFENLNNSLERSMNIYCNYSNNINCSTWNNFKITNQDIKVHGSHSIFIDNNRIKILNDLNYTGNRYWNYKFKKKR